MKAGETCCGFQGKIASNPFDNRIGPIMPRYVILTHDHPSLHWDLMFEHEEALRTWRLSATPTNGATVIAQALDDHRRMYLDYEGPVSNNRGTVVRWDTGVFEGPVDGDNRIDVQLHGEKLKGTVALTRQGVANHWELNYTASTSRQHES